MVDTTTKQWESTTSEQRPALRIGGTPPPPARLAWLRGRRRHHHPGAWGEGQKGAGLAVLAPRCAHCARMHLLCSSSSSAEIRYDDGYRN